jgi:hypothetical protein
MLIRRVALLLAFAGLAATPLSGASAQYYYPPCSPFPLAWPFCAAGAIVGTAANIATAPFWLTAGAPPPFYPAPRYYVPAYYPPPPPYYYGPR